MVDNGAGAFETDPTKIAAIMAEWLAPAGRAAFEAMAAASKALGRPEAVYRITEDLAKLAQCNPHAVGDGAAGGLQLQPLTAA